MPLTPEEQIAFSEVLRPVGMLVKIIMGCILSCFILPFGAFFLIIPVGLLLPTLGYQLYTMNQRRIAEGKTSLTMGKYRKIADHNHKFNQAVALFYMAAGVVMMGMMIYATIKNLFFAGTAP